MSNGNFGEWFYETYEKKIEQFYVLDIFMYIYMHACLHMYIYKSNREIFYS